MAALMLILGIRGLSSQKLLLLSVSALPMPEPEPEPAQVERFGGCVAPTLTQRGLGGGGGKVLRGLEARGEGGSGAGF